MNPSEQRHMLVIKAAAFVSVIYAYFMSRLRVARSSRPRITYAPMSAMDEEHQANLNKIYITAMTQNVLTCFACVELSFQSV